MPRLLSFVVFVAVAAATPVAAALVPSPYLHTNDGAGQWNRVPDTRGEPVEGGLGPRKGPASGATPGSFAFRRRPAPSSG